MIQLIDRIEYSITDQCNLNCAYCCHYAPIAEKYFVNVEQFKTDMYRLSELTHAGKVLGTLGILGGEPLLHKNFIDLCVIARQYLPLSRIRVTTNGLLLNKLSKQELCILRRFDIEILISEYRMEDDFKSMDELLNEYGIVHKFCNDNQLVLFSKYALDEKGDQDAEKSHNDCKLWQGYYTCHELRDGYLYPCSQIARVDSLNKKYGLHLPDKLQSAINIHTSDIVDILNFLEKPVIHCKYCKVSEWNKPVGLWKKSTKAKEEFV
jgi:MoaA/NifB/PqqE/SkfB family radical SAM enzyme